MEEEKYKPWNFYTCDLRRYGSKSSFIMVNHLDQHQRLASNLHRFHCDSNTPETYECELCIFKTDLKVNLSEHLQVFHKQQEINDVLPTILECYKCKDCCFNTYSLLVLLKHNCQDLNKDVPIAHEKASELWRFKCDKCPYKSKQKPNLERHILAKHARPEETDWYTCSKCSYKTIRKAYLKKHILVHTSPEEIVWYKCSKCSYKTRISHYLKKHILFKHGSPQETDWFKCEKCSFRCKRKDGLKGHILRKHTRPEEINWRTCSKCSYKTTTNSYLKNHILKKHSIPEIIHRYTCSKCSHKRIITMDNSANML